MGYIGQSRSVSVPSRGEWGVLPVGGLTQARFHELFPSPLEVNGSSYKSIHNPDSRREQKFPSPPEVTGGSNWSGIQL